MPDASQRTTTHDDRDIWSYTEALPDDPRFYRRTLDRQPSPLVVVDGAGRVIYGNEAMRRLGGWSEAESLDADLLSFVHPDDVERIAESFLVLAAIEEANDHWAPVTLRLVTPAGEVVPVEVTGRDHIEDDVISGVIYSVRPMTEQQLERGVIRGMSDGRPRAALLDAVLEILSAPPLHLAGGVISTSTERSMNLVASTHPEFMELVAGVTLSTFDDGLLRTAQKARSFAVADIDGPVGERLTAAGFVMGWRQVVGSGPMSLVVLSRRHHASDSGVRERLQIVHDLVGAILRVSD